MLAENFDDAVALFLAPMLAIHRAHLVMLDARRIIAPEDAHRLRAALDAVDESEIRALGFDGTFEDLFFLVERIVAEKAGADVAGRLHTARSRNDVDMTMYRMRQREWILAVVEAIADLRRTLLDLADRHVDTVFAALTHTQRAQPTTVAHYLMAAVEQFERDSARLAAAYARTNRCPLGACAITGTGFPIDRALTADLLGFDGPTGNTYGSIATADYLLESMSAVVVAAIGLGRLLQDLLLWSTTEFGYLRLGDGFVQSSSIMPQKRNPVALEHARALASRAVGEAQAVIGAVHNTPFGDVVDTEDDLQPVVFAAFQNATRCLRVAGAALATATFDVDRMAASAAESWTTLTELADTLVRDEGLPFRTAHAIAARLREDRERAPDAPLSEILLAAARDLAGADLANAYPSAALERILSPRHFIEMRTTPGGPAPDEVRAAIAASRGALATDDGAWREAAERLAAAGERLAERSARL